MECNLTLTGSRGYVITVDVIPANDPQQKESIADSEVESVNVEDRDIIDLKKSLSANRDPFCMLARNTLSPFPLQNPAKPSSRYISETTFPMEYLESIDAWRCVVNLSSGAVQVLATIPPAVPNNRFSARKYTDPPVISKPVAMTTYWNCSGAGLMEN